MTEESMSKYLVAPFEGDTGTPVLNVCPNNTNLGSLALTTAGVGNPFFVFASLASAILLANDIGADFTTGIICSDDIDTNNAAIADMLASPPPTGATAGGGNVVWVVD
jgi:hypothetical protein